jgi:phosphonopyruvate decarboxylase
MLDPAVFIGSLLKCGVQFFVGVPDSLLEAFCAQLWASVPAHRHVIAANEGTAVSLGAGWHLATNSVPCIYMQNSGLGNAVNPLVSLADADVYGIPMLLIIGWRGEMIGTRQLKDEPQHVKQGRITPALLSCLEIPYAILAADTPDPAGMAAALVKQALQKHRPTAIVVRKDTFSEVSQPPARHNYDLSREDALKILVNVLPDDAPIISTTGKLSRELHEIRIARGQSTDRDFLTVGSMGHAAQIASGIALAQPYKRVVCIDGDGAMIMQMGGLTTSATTPNLLHIVINNGAHESVGSQPTRAFQIDMPLIAKACGYALSERATSASEIDLAVRDSLSTVGASFIEIRTRTGSRSNLQRPKSVPSESNTRFIRSLGVQL